MTKPLLPLAKVTPGARVAVVSLASSVHAERVREGCAALGGLGYEAVLAPHALAKTPPYFAGTPEQRLSDLHSAFADPTIAAILCTRGGYGSNYLLAGLDLELIAAHPKPLIGYSDYTCIQSAMLDGAGLTSFHGPMVAADFARPEGVDLPSLRAALAGEGFSCDARHGLMPLREGDAEGTLAGGCLSLLTASLGTPYAAQLAGKLLFLEDVGVKPYQVDRMLRQLVLAGALEGVPGIVFGEMLHCVHAGAPPELLQAAILEALGAFRGAIGFGLRSGHVTRENVTLPLGRQARLQVAGTASLQVAGVTG